MRKLFALCLALCASMAQAQAVSNRGVIVKDEGTVQGFARSVDFVGSTVSCGISGGAATCTFTAPTVTLTADSTATSGFASPGLLGSHSNLLKAYTLSGTGTVIPTTASPTFTGTVDVANYFSLGGASASASFPVRLKLATDKQVYMGINSARAFIGAVNDAASANVPLDLRANPIAIYGGGSLLNQEVIFGGDSATNSVVTFDNFAATKSILTAKANSSTVFNIASNGATTAGSNALGTSVVPLTVTPGTGSTANLQNWTNSAGTILGSINSAGLIQMPRMRAGSGTGSPSSYQLTVGNGIAGWWDPGSGGWAYSYVGLAAMVGLYPVSGLALGLCSTCEFGWSPTLGAVAEDVRLGREAAAILQMGSDVNGAAVNQTLKAHDGITGTDISGASLTIAAGRGTGTGAEGSLIFQTAPVLTTGTTAQTLATVLTLGKDKSATFTGRMISSISNSDTVCPGGVSDSAILSSKDGYNCIRQDTSNNLNFDVYTGVAQQNTAMRIKQAGGVTIGSNALGTSVVPLTVTPGTGSTANLQNWTDSTGAVVGNIKNTGGTLNLRGTYGIRLDGTGSGSYFDMSYGSGNIDMVGHAGRHSFGSLYSQNDHTAMTSSWFIATNPDGGAATAGFGVGLRFVGESSTTASQNMGLIGAQWTTATHASRTSKVVAQNVNNAGSLATTWEAQNGHDRTVGTAPVITSCGTSPSTVTGSDGNGRFTVGSTGTVTSCTLTFAIAYNVAPACIANNETALEIVRAVATTATLTIDGTDITTDTITYICRGN